MSRYRALLPHSDLNHELIPVPICTLGGWHLESHGAVRHTAIVIASRAMIPFERAREFLFQRHDAQLGVGSANYIMQGWALEVRTFCLFVLARTFV